jgi:hypothetical protein
MGHYSEHQQRQLDEYNKKVSERNIVEALQTEEECFGKPHIVGAPSGYISKGLCPTGSYLDADSDECYPLPNEALKDAKRKYMDEVDLDNLIKSRAAHIEAAESDSYGLDQHELGAKLDAGKVRPGLVLGDFSNALLAVSELGTFGATKYTDHGWSHAENGISRYTDAMMRHLLKHQTGELIDDDTGLSHLTAVAWNILAVLELTIKEQKGK